MVNQLPEHIVKQLIERMPVPPQFYFGTPIKVDQDRQSDMTYNELKYPFCCLFAPITSDFYPSGESLIQEDAELWLIFMTANQSEDDIEDMNQLLLDFIKVCETSTDIVLFDEEQRMKVTRYLEYGLYAKTKGIEKTLFRENLCGVEVESLKLRITKKYSC